MIHIPIQAKKQSIGSIVYIMEDSSMKRAFPIIGCLFPLLLGNIINYFLINTTWYYRYAAFPVSVVVLLIWFLLGFYAIRFYKSKTQTILALNFPAFIILLLVLLQQIILGYFWLNIIGSESQIFFLPLMSLAVSITVRFLGPILFAYITSFLLLVVASFVGCVVGERRRK